MKQNRASYINLHVIAFLVTATAISGANSAETVAAGPAAAGSSWQPWKPAAATGPAADSYSWQL